MPKLVLIGMSEGSVLRYTEPLVVVPSIYRLAQWSEHCPGMWETQVQLPPLCFRGENHCAKSYKAGITTDSSAQN